MSPLKDSDSNSFPSGNIYIAYKDSFKLNVPLDLIYTGYFQPTLEPGSDYHNSTERPKEIQSAN